MYGVNTGFGSFAEVMIAPEALETLQRNLVRSHAAGLGAPLSIASVRAAMPLRANVLAKGFSGIRFETLEALIAMLNARVHPWSRPADRSAQAGIWRRSRTSRSS